MGGSVPRTWPLFQIYFALTTTYSPCLDQILHTDQISLQLDDLLEIFLKTNKPKLSLLATLHLQRDKTALKNFVLEYEFCSLKTRTVRKRGKNSEFHKRITVTRNRFSVDRVDRLAR